MGEASREILFAKTLEKVRGIAKEQANCISEEQVRREFDQLGLTKEQLRLVFEYLEKHKIGIDEPADPDSFLTQEEKNYLKDYLDKIEALSFAGGGERDACILAAMAGEEEARRRLMENSLKDVADIAKLYTGQGVLLEDLIGEGNVALAAGMDGLEEVKDPSQVQGMLARRIMDAMEELIQETASNEKIDKKAADRVNHVASEAKKLAGELRRKVTVEELAQESGLSVKSIRDALLMSGYKIEDIEYAENSL